MKHLWSFILDIVNIVTTINITIWVSSFYTSNINYLVVPKTAITFFTYVFRKYINIFTIVAYFLSWPGFTKNYWDGIMGLSNPFYHQDQLSTSCLLSLLVCAPAAWLVPSVSSASVTTPRKTPWPWRSQPPPPPPHPPPLSSSSTGGGSWSPARIRAKLSSLIWEINWGIKI